jgi:hypothetical protein
LWVSHISNSGLTQKAVRVAALAAAIKVLLTDQDKEIAKACAIHTLYLFATR